jgi:hypothetical protein
MATWLRIEKKHKGKTAGAVLQENGTPFVPAEHRLVIIYGKDHDAVALAVDDVIMSSDVALCLLDLPESLRKSI